MKRLFLPWLFFMVAMSSCLYSAEANQEEEFIVFSIPKCGSGLINKFLGLASKKKMRGPRFWFSKYSTECKTSSFDVEKYLDGKSVRQELSNAKRDRAYLFSHTNFSRPFFDYLLKNDQLKCVLQIRDLRDACISLIYWKEGNIAEIIGKDATFDEKLLFVISGADSVYKNQVFNLKECAVRALELIDHPNVVVSRFEDLVGDKGGGDDRSQLELINEITEKLSLRLSIGEREHIASILWGNEEGPHNPTFRQGQINKWKQIFTPRHKKVFKKYFGDVLIQLGYEQDNNW